MTRATITFDLAGSRYRYVEHMSTNNLPYWIIGNTDTSANICFAYSEMEAQHICLALSLLDAHVQGYEAEKLSILREAEKLRSH